MAELNFDELDQAVTSYMKQKSGPDTPPSQTVTPASEPAPSPLPGSSPGSSPAAPPSNKNSATPASATSVAPATPERALPKPAALPRIQLRPRVAATGRLSSSHTFHDVVPAQRRSAAALSKQVAPSGAPISEVMPTPIAPAPKEPVASAPEPAPVSIASPPEADEALVPPAPQEAKEAPEVPMRTEPDQTAEVVEQSEHVTKDDASSQPAISTPQQIGFPTHTFGGSAQMSDALLEDLQKETNKLATPPPASDAPKSGLLSQTPLELEDDKPEETPETPPAPKESVPAAAPTGLMRDTGEIHTSKTTATPVDPSHMLEAGDDDEQPHKIFDTKEYHAPISEHETTGHGSKKWIWLIVMLLVMVMAAAGFVAYVMIAGS